MATLKMILSLVVVGTLSGIHPTFGEPLGPVKIFPDSKAFTAPLEVTLVAESGASIRYTLDGSVPSSTNGMDYDGPIRVHRTTQIRAIPMLDGERGEASGAHFVHLSGELANHKSTLPIMIISTFANGAIPGKGWNQMGIGIKQVPRLSAAWMLFERDPQKNLASFGTMPQVVSRIGIRQRGSFSSTWNQKPYSVEAWDEADEDIDVAPLGMPAEADWVLYYPDPTPQKDRTLLYNAFMWELSRKVGRYSPRFRFVEAFVNEDGGSLDLSDRRGVYALVEKVKRGKNRLPFEVLSDDGSSGGWMLSINRMDAEPAEGWPASNGAMSPQFFHTAGPDRRLQSPPNELGRGDDFPTVRKAQFNFENPNGYKILPAQRQGIESWLKQFEDVLYDNDRWLDPEFGYHHYIDVIDFADFHIFKNLAQNYDGLLLSMYPWKSSVDGKLRMGPTWDFNWDCYDQSGSFAKSVMYQANALWYRRLFQDSAFMRVYLDRWKELRGGPLSDESIREVIAGLVDEVGEENAVAQGIPTASEWRSRVESMQAWLLARADWLDKRLPMPPQFSIEEGLVARGTRLMLTAPAPSAGVVYYTVDGTDPRSPNGQPSARAKVFDAFKNVSFLRPGAKARAIIPSDGAFGDRWIQAGFDDSDWLSGSTGVGYDEDGTYDRLIRLDLSKEMAGKHTSALIRIPFEVNRDPLKLMSLTLNVAYDDGFVAYLNGHRIVSQNAPTELHWSSVQY
ncbi:MAG: CotH kinase family protein [Verrucomicrobiae bacterium]|nr:CotH kinase family protein [Verrucomicrobiae bacterium]